MFFHVFTQTTHVVAAPHGFACVVIPATRLYIQSFIEIRSGVSEPQGVKIWPFPLLWLVAFTTACTTVQAVTSRDTFFKFFALFFGSRRAHKSGPILTIYTSYDVFPPKDVPFGGLVHTAPHFGGKVPKRHQFWGRE